YCVSTPDFAVGRRRPGACLLAQLSQLGLVTVESRTGAGAWGHAASLRFPSPLIKPDVRISRIRLSDWFHLTAHGGDTELVRAAEAAGDGKRVRRHWRLRV